MKPTCPAARSERDIRKICGRSLRPIIMPPNAIMVLIGGRSFANQLPASVEGFRAERSAALRGAGLVGMIVGPGRRQRERGKSFARKAVEHGRRVVDKGFGLCPLQPIADMVRQVFQRGCRRIGDAGCPLMRVVRHPHHTRRIGRGAAKQRLLLGRSALAGVPSAQRQILPRPILQPARRT
jgi:hypothetical protein